MIGQTISHYKIIEKLGEGGMGEVYRAQDLTLDRQVALKFMAAGMVGDPQADVRFVREAKAAAALAHPNICTVFEIDKADDRVFIAMECIEGRTLKDRIQGGPLSLSEALDIAGQTLSGLLAAHAKGIVHRDIKPANILINPEGLAKITDFGLARSAGQTQVTQVGTTLGTFAYMAPEQARGRKTDHRTDIWSLGAVLYEMVSGRPPFRGAHEQAVVHAALNEDPEPLTALRTDVPAELERIIAKALARSPKDRYQHLDDMQVDLKAVAAGLGGPKRVPEKRQGVPPLVVVGIVVAAAIVVSLGLLLMRGGSSSPDSRVSIRSLAVLPFDNLAGDEEQASYFAWAGDAEQTFAWLEKAFEERTPSMLHMIMKTALDPFRSDPRFTNLLQRMGLPIHDPTAGDDG